MSPHTSTPKRALTIVMIVLVLLMAACKSKTPIQKLAFALLSSVEELSDHKDLALTVLKKAQKARAEAQQEIEFTYTNPKTQIFIRRWQSAAKQVRRLRQSFNSVIRRADFYFAYAEKKSRKIQNVKIKNRMDRSIRSRKSAFTEAAQETDGAIRAIEREIRLGNDLITALEIAGSLNTVDKQFAQLDNLHEQSLAELPKLSRLVDAGIQILQSELDGLETSF